MSSPVYVALVSGGLDASLAAALLRAAGADVRAVHFDTGFGSPGFRRALGLEPTSEIPASSPARVAGFDVEVRDVFEAYLREVVVAPRFGYGGAMNPCIDCRIFMARRARAACHGGVTVASGDVVGQRPGSQDRRAFAIVDRELGAPLSRPLSARRLGPTNPHGPASVAVESLGALHGSGRRGQRALAAELGLDAASAPGGRCCRLADRSFAARLRDLLAHRDPGAVTREDVARLAVGRHFRLGHRGKIVVARDERESAWLERSAARAELAWMRVEDDRGAVVVVEEGGRDEARLGRAAGFAVRFSSHRGARSVQVRIRRASESAVVAVDAAREREIAACRVGPRPRIVSR